MQYRMVFNFSGNDMFSCFGEDDDATDGPLSLPCPLVDDPFGSAQSVERLVDGIDRGPLAS
jgi:hypothetical protein